MPFDPIQGSQRAVLSDVVSKKVEAQVPLLREERRRRPLYFDGRFLAARDLTREQDYFLARQADLGRAGGFGVVAGLTVSGAGSKIAVAPGHGITPSGELVVISAPMSLDVAQLEPSEAVRVKVGIRTRVREVIGKRTGLYILALRPIEYEANPIAQYPTSLDGERAVHNGDIIEAAALTLIPYPDLGAPTELLQRRAHAAKEIFVDQVRSGFVTDALPLAMVAIDRGNLLWVDMHLARREVGADAGDLLGVSGSPLALREAQMLQYADHLQDVLATVHGGIVAAQHFLVLPPAGPMPKSSIDRQLFAQRFFPAEVDVDISVVPTDELGAILEEARLLPPIDLTDADELKGTSVLVLVPVDREDLDETRKNLVAMRRALPAAAPNLLAKLRPLDRLLALPQIRQTVTAAVPAATAEDIAWRKLLDLDRANDLVWYVRRRTLAKKPAVVPEVLVTAPGDEELDALARRLADFGVTQADAHRVDPALWKVAREPVLKLEKRVPLYAAAALVEVSQAPAIKGSEETKAWERAFVERFRFTSEDTEKRLQKTFAAGRPVTAALVRAGILHELAVPFSILAGQPIRMDEWARHLAEIEAAKEPATTKAARLRALLFAVLDVQAKDLERVSP